MTMPSKPKRWRWPGPGPYHAHCTDTARGLWTLEGGNGDWAHCPTGVALWRSAEEVEDEIAFEGHKPGPRTNHAGVIQYAHP
jgi:hypothetical protein